MPEWVAPVGIPTAIVALITAGVWAGKVIERLGNLKGTADADRKVFQKTADDDRKSFQEAATEDRKRIRQVLDEIRDDIKRIFLRIGRTEATGGSPLRLTDYGRELLTGIDGKGWAIRLATTLEERVVGMEAYEIQDFCYGYVANDLNPSEEEQAAMRRTAYEKAARMEQVRRVLAIELRDRLLELSGQEAPE